MKPNINLQDFIDDDLISLFQSMEEDNGGEPIPHVPIMAKALVDLENHLKMPFKDIASSESNSLQIRTALNFLSRLSLDHEALTNELKAIIESLHQYLPSILHSYNQAFTTINKIAVLEERDKCMKKELEQKKGGCLCYCFQNVKGEEFFL